MPCSYYSHAIDVMVLAEDLKDKKSGVRGKNTVEGEHPAVAEWQEP